MSWTERLIEDYRKSKSKITRYRARLLRIDKKELTDRQAEEIVKLNEIVNSMVFAIEWMRTGHEPGTYRGIDRRGAYREPRVLDKDLFPSLQEPKDKTFRLTPADREYALAVIGCLSEREFNCLMLHAVNRMSYSDIGETLKLSRHTVRVYVERARKKILSSQS